MSQQHDQSHYHYLIVGGGMTADAAVRGIRDADAAGTIGLIAAEPDLPYKRPPLSKKLWQGKKLESVWLKSDRFGAEFHLGRTVRLLDLHHKLAVDDRGAAAPGQGDQGEQRGGGDGDGTGAGGQGGHAPILAGPVSPQTRDLRPR